MGKLPPGVGVDGLLMTARRARFAIRFVSESESLRADLGRPASGNLQSNECRRWALSRGSIALLLWRSHRRWSRVHLSRLQSGCNEEELAPHSQAQFSRLQ